VKKLNLGTVVLMIFIVGYTSAITFAYDYDGKRWSNAQAEWRFSTDFPSGYKTAVKNAADTWSNAGSAFNFDYDWYELYNKVDWEDLGSDGPLALTYLWYSGTPSYSCGTGASLTRVVTDFNNQYEWTTSPDESYPPYDVETVALHEFGHWLVLDDVYSSGPVMYIYYDGTQRSLTQDDIDGIICIYGS